MRTRYYYAVENEIRRYDLHTGAAETTYRSRMPLATTATFDVSPVDRSLLLPGVVGALVVPPDGQPVLRFQSSGLAALA